MYIIVSAAMGVIFSIAEILLFENKKNPLNWLKVLLKNLLLISVSSFFLGAYPYNCIIGSKKFTVFTLRWFGVYAFLYQLSLSAATGIFALLISGVTKGRIAIEKPQKSKKAANVIVKIISTVLIFLGVFAWHGTIWARETYNGISADQMLINLISPTDGTSSEIMNSMIEGPVLKSLMFTAWLCVPVWAAVELVYIKGEKRRVILKDSLKRWTSLLLAVAVLGAGVSFGVLKLQLKDLFYAYAVKSDIIDKNYVDPETTTLVFPEKKRNLIHIYLESMENSYASKDLGGYMDANLIPELTELSKEGISFSDRGEGQLGGPIQATGSQWSVASMVCMGTGLPMKVPMRRNGYGAKDNFLPGAYTLGDILKAQGYEQTVMFGASAVFGGLSYYFESHGNFKIMDHNYMINNGVLPEGYKVWWGYEDEKLFKYAKEELTRLSETGKPFNFVMETADTHFPDGYITSKTPRIYKSQYANVIAYSSSQVTEFVRWIQQQPFYENTTIVINGDHASMDKNFFKDFDPSYRRTVYNVILNPDKSVAQVGADRRYNREYASFDMMPTMLASLGVKIDGDRLGIGTNLFSDEQTVFEKYGVDYVNGELNKGSDLYNKEIMRKQ